MWPLSRINVYLTVKKQAFKNFQSDRKRQKINFQKKKKNHWHSALENTN